MKNIFALLIASLSLSTFAHTIEGVQLLKGSLKAEIRVYSIKTTCKVKVKEVKNLMEEDHYGNPAYKAEVEVSLDGGSFASPRKVKYEKLLLMTNLFPDGVRDLEYYAEGVKLKITSEGRFESVQIPYFGSTVVCNF
jgi:hypothetical protein